MLATAVPHKARVFLLIALFACVRSHAEIDPNAILNALQSANAGSSSTSGSESLPSTPEITPAAQQKPPEDRSDKNGMAKALAMAGAAFALVSCMDLQRQAAKAPEGTEKALLKSMANQQCSQGMKDMADAAKNDDAKNQLTQADSPSQSQLKTQPFQAPKATSEKPLVSNPTNTAPTDSTTPDSTPTPEAEKPVAEAPKKAPPSNLGEEVPYQEKTVVLDKTSTPGAIDDAKLRFDETAKGGGVGGAIGANNALGPNAFFALGGSPNNSDLKKLKEQTEEHEKSGPRRGVASNSDAEAAAGGDTIAGGAAGGAAANGKDDPFQGMLNQIMGGGPAAEAGFGGSFGGTEIAATGKGNNGKPGPNIFEYANYRFRHLTYNDGRIKARAPKSTTSASSLSSSDFTIATSQAGKAE